MESLQPIDDKKHSAYWAASRKIRGRSFGLLLVIREPYYVWILLKDTSA